MVRLHVYVLLLLAADVCARNLETIRWRKDVRGVVLDESVVIDNRALTILMMATQSDKLPGKVNTMSLHDFHKKVGLVAIKSLETGVCFVTDVRVSRFRDARNEMRARQDETIGSNPCNVGVINGVLQPREVGEKIADFCTTAMYRFDEPEAGEDIPDLPWPPTGTMCIILDTDIYDPHGIMTDPSSQTVSWMKVVRGVKIRESVVIDNDQQTITMTADEADQIGKDNTHSLHDFNENLVAIKMMSTGECFITAVRVTSFDEAKEEMLARQGQVLSSSLCNEGVVRREMTEAEVGDKIAEFCSDGMFRFDEPVAGDFLPWPPWGQPTCIVIDTDIYDLRGATGPT